MNYAIDLNSFIPVTRFNKGEAGKILDEVAYSGAKVIVKNNYPAAIMLSPESYESLLEKIEDAEDYALAVLRESSGDNKKTFSQEEVMKEFGITDKDLENAEEAELEYELAN